MKTKIREIEKSKVLEENTGQAIVTFNYEVNASACVADHVSDIEEWFVRKLRREPNAPKFRGKNCHSRRKSARTLRYRLEKHGIQYQRW